MRPKYYLCAFQSERQAEVPLEAKSLDFVLLLAGAEAVSMEGAG